MLSLLIAFLVAYFVALFAIAWISRSDEGYNGFIIGNREVGLWGIVSSLGANLRDGSGMVIFTTLAALIGLMRLPSLSFLRRCYFTSH